MFRNSFMAVVSEKAKICLASAMMMGVILSVLIVPARIFWWSQGFAPLVPASFPPIGYITLPCAAFVWLLITVPTLLYKEKPEHWWQNW